LPGLQGNGSVLIEARDVSAGYPGIPALRGVNLAVKPGEIITVIGPNGSGKSTLLKTLLGALQPTSGTVARAPGLRIGYVPQRLELGAALPMTVRRFLSLPDRQSRAATAMALEQVGVPGVEERQISELSGGQWQRVLLARALLAAPQVLILDEPAQGLDQPGIAAFYRLLVDVRDRTGAAILLVSHDLHVVMSRTDRVICLNGHICCEGSPDAVLEAPEYRALFGEGTGGALALYQHHHDHDHDHVH
jgi:zinc transport system ATP-binding protein